MIIGNNEKNTLYTFAFATNDLASSDQSVRKTDANQTRTVW
jgi:hypothetical protein